MNKIGIWNTAFLGDAVLTLPLIHTLRRAYPEAELHFYVRRGLAPLFSEQPELIQAHGFDKRGMDKGFCPAYGMGRDLARQGFDLWISAHVSLRSGLIARWSSIPLRIGYNRPWFNRFFYTHTVDRAFSQYEEIERLLRLTIPLGIKDLIHTPKLVLPKAAVDKANDFFEKNIQGPALGIHPGSTWPTKMWPVKYFAKVLKEAVASGVQVLMFAGPGEEALAGEIVAKAEIKEQGNRVFNMAGDLSLTELAAHIARLGCYLSNDSGPMHLAWVQNVPVTALFGPTVRELGFYPRGERSLVLERDLPCRPCSLHGPRVCPEGHHKCMREILPDTVWDAVRENLETG